MFLILGSFKYSFKKYIKKVKPGFTNYQPHPSSLGPDVNSKGGTRTRIYESKHRKILSKNPDCQSVAPT